jgi:hypothetical protein
MMPEQSMKSYSPFLRAVTRLDCTIAAYETLSSHLCVARISLLVSRIEDMNPFSSEV